MAAGIVFAVYGCSAALALLLLFVFGARKWYWHVASVVLALLIGLVPVPETLRSTGADLAVGGTFLFLMVWGICAPAFRKQHWPRHGAPKHA